MTFARRIIDKNTVSVQYFHALCIEILFMEDRRSSLLHRVRIPVVIGLKFNFTSRIIFTMYTSLQYYSSSTGAKKI